MVRYIKHNQRFNSSFSCSVLDSLTLLTNSPVLALLYVLNLAFLLTYGLNWVYKHWLYRFLLSLSVNTTSKFARYLFSALAKFYHAFIYILDTKFLLQPLIWIPYLLTPSSFHFVLTSIYSLYLIVFMAPLTFPDYRGYDDPHYLPVMDFNLPVFLWYFVITVRSPRHKFVFILLWVLSHYNMCTYDTDPDTFHTFCYQWFV